MREAFFNALRAADFLISKDEDRILKDDVYIRLTLNSFRAEINLIYVPEEQRRQGRAGRVLKDVLGAADRSGLILYLAVDPVGPDGPDAADLRRFYEAAGFVFCGKSKDGKDTLSRKPETDPEIIGFGS